MKDVVIGIDLGTTNSEVAGLVDGKIRILGGGGGGGQMLPSCVGLSPSGELLIGQTARNQQLLYPDRTIRSIKRKMGSHEPVTLGDRTYTPPDISALLLRELAQWAGRGLGGPVNKAVITVPAYFSDVQRQATREAGGLAGLEVVRLINEPTAASLSYGYGEKSNRTVMVYDLGGGTFDVSIVEIEDKVTQVLASHGNTLLGGDDFDQLLTNHLVAAFKAQHSVDLNQPEHRGALVRLSDAAEEAKKRLSFEPYVTVREEALVELRRRPLHLEVEISRRDYEGMIRPLVESTLESVSKALSDADRNSGQIDVVLLVGGSTRTPLVSEIIEQRMGAAPRQDVHPDLCVALGAGLLASRVGGHEVEKVLVDISPYTFGVSYLGEKDGVPYPRCFKPIIHRNTPLPVTRGELFYTAHAFQESVEVDIFQGENSDAMQNTLVSDFRIKGLNPIEEPNPVLCRMKLDLDGILQVAAIEKRTSMSKEISIADALKKRTKAELAAARERLEALFATRETDDDDVSGAADDADESASLKLTTEADEAAVIEPTAETESAKRDPAFAKAMDEGKALIERSEGLLDGLHEDDRTEAVELKDAIEQAICEGQPEAVRRANERLRELLFFVEAR